MPITKTQYFPNIMNIVNCNNRKKSPRDMLDKENSANSSGCGVSSTSTSSINKNIFTPNFNRKRRNSRGSTNKSTTKKQKTTPMITKRMSIPNRPSRISKRDSSYGISNDENFDGFPSVETVSHLCASLLLNSEKKGCRSNSKSHTPYYRSRRNSSNSKNRQNKGPIDLDDDDDDFSPTFLAKRCRGRQNSPNDTGSPSDVITPREDDYEYDRSSPILEEVEENGSPSSAKLRIGARMDSIISRSPRERHYHGQRRPSSFSHDLSRPPLHIKSRHIRSRSASLTDVLETLGVNGEKFIKPTQRLATEIMTRGKKAGIKLLALDWDNTVLKLHTRGQWYGNSDELYNNVRPFFIHLIQAAQCFKIHVSIVTFSGQTKLITEVMQKIMNINSSNANVDHGQYSIRCCDDTWDGIDALKEYFPSHIDCEFKGKLQHISSVLKECMKDNVMPHETLLIDDDEENIRVAKEVNLPSIRFDPDDEMSLADSLCEIFVKIGNSKNSVDRKK